MTATLNRPPVFGLLCARCGKVFPGLKWEAPWACPDCAKAEIFPPAPLMHQDIQYARRYIHSVDALAEYAHTIAPADLPLDHTWGAGS